MDSIKESYEEALGREFKELALANPEKKDKVLSNIDTLSKHFVDILKEEHNHEEKMERLKMEQDQYDDSIVDRRDEMVLRQEELTEKKLTRRWNSGIAIASTIAGALLTLLMTAGMFSFEEEHTFTSSVRNGVQKYVFDLFKKKK